MGIELAYSEGQTPLDDDEKDGLLIPAIATRCELDEFEQQNIEQAMQWLLGRKIKTETIFTEAFIQLIHQKMFGEVWAWTGSFRQSNKNIGPNYWKIPIDLRQLLNDVLYWHHNKTFSPDEIALRFKHRLISIHCFANGNGRHSRLMADIVIEKVYKLPVFSWGVNTDHTQKRNARESYLKAVKAADRGDYSLLMGFARS